MKKPFCDLCDAPAKEAVTEFVREPYGETYTFKDGVDGNFRAKIEMRLCFVVVDHATHFGGPPDLCPECKVKLTEKMLEKMKSNLPKS